jgi:3-oxoacid CoA-transferase A subunit
MRPTIYETMEEAVADVADGSFILVGGMGPGGYPFNLMEALFNQGAKDLTFASNAGSTFGRRGPVDFIHFHDQGRIRKQIGTGFASGHPSRPTPVEKLWREGKIEYELLPQGTLAERIRAAGAGIPAFYTPTGVGTEIAEGKEYREFNGRGYILEEAMYADYALVHAWKADTAGNLIFRRSSRNFGPIMAQAARVAIVEVEEPIVPAGELDPDSIHCAGVFVQRAVAIGPTGRKNINIREMREQMFNEQQMAKVAGARQGGSS